jgi:hypothetical protein
MSIWQNDLAPQEGKACASYIRVRNLLLELAIIDWGLYN